MAAGRVLVICHPSFVNGFKMLADPSIPDFWEKERWKNVHLFKKIRILSNYDVIHYFWARVNFPELIYAILAKKHVILHFIGSDVVLNNKSRTRIWKTKLAASLGARILTVSENLKNELAAVGIKSEILPFVNRKVEDLKVTLPENRAVLVYMPENKESFYGIDLIEEAAENMPDVDFFLFPTKKKYSLNNLISMPAVEHEAMPALFMRYPVFIRLPRHDGLPNTLIEALMCARNVIWSFEHPFVYQAKNSEDLIHHITKLLRFPRLNFEGKKYVLEKYNHRALAKRYNLLWSK